MAHLTIPVENVANEIVIEHIKILCQKAYEQGVKDAQAKHSYPKVLTKDHLVQIFQIEKPTVNKLITKPNFPKLKDIQARYPRDQVFEWIELNSTYVKQHTNYFSKEAM